MLKNNKISLILLGLCLYSFGFAQVREIALTIDDLPFVGSSNNNESKLKRENQRLQKIIQALVEHKIPAIGFVIAGTIEKDQLQLLEQFRDEGFVIGNHTYSHPNLNINSAKKYIEDIDRADKLLQPLMTTPKYFRYPYLAEGKGEKKAKVNQYLIENNYVVAPVTIDSKDYLFNSKLFAIPWRLREKNLEQLKQRYLAYVWAQTLRAEANAKRQHVDSARQILLVHANLLNSHFLGDVIEMYQRNGYTFISLIEALKEPAPAINAAIDELPKMNEIPKAAMSSEMITSLFSERVRGVTDLIQ